MTSVAAPTVGAPCYVASRNEYGCVDVALNHRSGEFTAGRGPDEASAMQDAANKTASYSHPDGFGKGTVHCSNPSTPPPYPKDHHSICRHCNAK